MLEVSEGELTQRAERLWAALGDERARIVRTAARVGGGALPLLELEGPAVELRSDVGPDEILASLRRSDPPVIGRIHDGRVLLDPRTLSDEEVEMVARAAGTALA
jgi:L-seryl-tRNA(Ser) seleniumtransferase